MDEGEGKGLRAREVPGEEERERGEGRGRRKKGKGRVGNWIRFTLSVETYMVEICKHYLWSTSGGLTWF